MLTKLLLIAQLSGFWALNVSNFLGFSTVPVGLVFFLFPAISLGLIDRTGTSIQPSHKKNSPLYQPVSASQYVLISITLVFTILGLLRVSRMYRADKAYAAGKTYMEVPDLLSAIASFQKAFNLDPKEPLYTDQLSLAMAQGATVLVSNNQATQAAAIAKQAVLFSDRTVQQNNVHLNYWKTRARVFLHLTNVDPNYLYEAQKALLTAQTLSPTDPKIVYNLGLIQQQLGNQEEAFQLFKRAIELKPNYQDVRLALAKEYEERGDIQTAIEQYQFILDYISPKDGISKEAIDRLENLELSPSNANQESN
jgi:tetratricopeptide (TPR) repeat protein